MCVRAPLRASNANVIEEHPTATARQVRRHPLQRIELGRAPRARDALAQRRGGVDGVDWLEDLAILDHRGVQLGRVVKVPFADGLQRCGAAAANAEGADCHPLKRGHVRRGADRARKVDDEGADVRAAAAADLAAVERSSQQ